MKYYQRTEQPEPDLRIRFEGSTSVDRSIPLVLAGPILRRVEPTSATVWLALKHSRQVTVRVHRGEGPSATTVLEGSRDTVSVGDFCHVVAVNATPTGNQRLEPGTIYRYDVQVGQQALTDPGVLTTTGYDVDLTYDGFDRPTFALPPTDLDDLHLMHASCRKPHAPGQDALPAVDRMIQSTAGDPAERPHQLYLTGDQIYADDVADTLLSLLTDAGEALLGWTERLPKDPGFRRREIHPDGDRAYATPQELPPGRRAAVAADQCKFTSEHAESHLLGLGEFMAMYLFTWSDSLWPPSEALPRFEDVFPDGKTHERRATMRPPFVRTEPTENFERYRAQTGTLQPFLAALSAVRRALANVPTYTIFDDHEVTDDWFLHRNWCINVLSKSPMGRRVVQNALIAYALCQGWGNRPDQFAQGTPGRALLDDVVAGLRPHGQRTDSLTDHALGIPDVPPSRDRLNWPDANNRIAWHYRPHTGPVDAVVLDTRTWRRFRRAGSPPEVIGLQTYQTADQFGPVPTDAPPVTLVVSAVPIWIAPVHQKGKEALSLGGAHRGDTEEWHHEHAARERLFAALARRGHRDGDDVRTRVVALSGDVHYGYAVRMRGWFEDTPWTDASDRHDLVVANLVSSPAKNQDRLTESFHQNGYSWLSQSIFGRDIGHVGRDVSSGLTGQSQPPRLVCAGWLRPESELRSFVPTRDGQPFPPPATLSEVERLVPVAKDRLLQGLARDPTFGEYRGGTAEFVRRLVDDWINGDVRLTPVPDWRYRVDFLVDDDQVQPADQPGGDDPVPPPGTAARTQALRRQLARLDKVAREQYNRLIRRDGTVTGWGVGREIAGFNNVGEVSFDWSGNQPAVRQSLWFSADGGPQFPWQTIVVPMDFDSPDFPRPNLGWGQ